MINVLGAGSWGTALAIHLAKKQPTCLVARDEATAKTLEQERQNSQFLPDISFPKNLTVNHQLSANAKFIVVAVPSHAVAQVLEQNKNIIKNTTIVCAAKGVNPSDRRFLHDVAKDICPDSNFVALAGPSFAIEVAEGLLTAITLASDKPCDEVFSAFHHGLMRVYTSNDVLGAEIGGLVKNVIAIAAGAADGVGLGANARAALLTRGLAEMMRFGQACGAESRTMIGLSGLGDLILTAGDNKSRNRRFGLYLGQGMSPAAAVEKVGQVVEGSRNTADLLVLSKEKNIDMPIVQAVGKLINGERTVQEVLMHLMERDPKEE